MRERERDRETSKKIQNVLREIKVKTTVSKIKRKSKYTQQSDKPEYTYENAMKIEKKK